MINIKILNEAIKKKPISPNKFGLSIFSKENFYNLVFIDLKNLQNIDDPDDYGNLLEVQQETPFVIGWLKIDHSIGFNTLQMFQTAIHGNYANRGLGTEFYKVAMYFATLKGKEGIRPHTSPSASALGVWAKIDTDSNVENSGIEKVTEEDGTIGYKSVLAQPLYTKLINNYKSSDIQIAKDDLFDLAEEMYKGRFN